MGFRYYLPPTMVRLLTSEDDGEWFAGHLLGIIDRFAPSQLPHAWTPAQLRSIARFISFMARHDEDGVDLNTKENTWAAGLAQRWNAHLNA